MSLVLKYDTKGCINISIEPFVVTHVYPIYYFMNKPHHKTTSYLDMAR